MNTTAILEKAEGIRKVRAKAAAVNADLTPTQLMEKAKLDWTVTARQAFVNIKSKQEKIPIKGLFRDSDNKLLTTITSGWKHVQNHEAFSLFDGFTAAGDMSMHSAGSYHDGELVWIKAKYKTYEVVKNDIVDSYIMLTNPHRYGWRIRIDEHSERLVCANGMTRNISANVAKIDHRREFDTNEVMKMMGVAAEQVLIYQEQAKFLAAKAYTPEMMKEFFSTVFPRTSDAKKKNQPGKQFKRAIELAETQPGHDLAPGTFWNLFNAVTYIVDHEMGKTTENRAESAIYGSGSKLKHRAMAIACAMAK